MPSGFDRGSAPVVVIGDSLLDVDVDGAPVRLSPGDAAPVVEEPVESLRPGGAGLTAVLAGADRRVVLVTALGRDRDGERLRDLLGDVEVRDLGRAATVVKTRIRANGRTLARLDHGTSAEPEFGPVPDEIADLIAHAGVVLASDYGLGLLELPAIRRALAARPQRIPLVWDPHVRGAVPVPGTTVCTPNEDEASHCAQVPGRGLQASVEQARRLVEVWGAANVVVTRGRAGATVVNGSQPPVVVPALAVTVTDTCGAGDAFAAALACALADGAGLPDAVQIAVGQASRFVQCGAASGPWRAGLGLPEPQPGPGSASDVVAGVRAAGGTVVLAGGCFDLLHAGHVAYLEAARALGDCLVVAVNDDSSVRRLKGPDRPVVRVEDRVRVLESLRCVDAVEVFHEATPSAVIERIKPDIFAKGGDYTHDSLPEAGLVEALGGQVVLLPLLAGRSSSRLVAAARGDDVVEEVGAWAGSRTASAGSW